MNVSAHETACTPINWVSLGGDPADTQDSRPVYVLLHGWQRSLQAMQPLGELLSTNARVVLVDLPGFGSSPLPEGASNAGGGWDTVQYAQRLCSFLEEAGIGRCVLIGHSFGARVAVRFALRYPEVVLGMVLMGAAGVPRDRSLKDRARIALIRRIVTLSRKIDSLTGSSLFQRYLSPRFGSRDYLLAGELRRTLVKAVNEDLSDEAAELTVPTLLLWGAEDPETPVEIARKYRNLIRDSELHIFPHKGHEPFADVGAHLMAAYIERFTAKRGLGQ